MHANFNTFRDRNVDGSGPNLPRFVTASRRHSVTPQHAFTLVEALVVIVIITILAGLIVPRMLSTGPRLDQGETKAVQRLLSVAAEKSALLGQPVAVEYTAANSTLRVLVQRSRLDDQGQPLAPEWIVDSLVEPVTLEYTQLKDARASGVVLEKSAWRITFPPGQPRPEVLLVLSRKDAQDQLTRIALPTYAAGALREDASPGARPSAATIGAIDLDDAGKGTKTW